MNRQPRRPEVKSPSGPGTRPAGRAASAQASTSVAEMTAAIAPAVLHAVFSEHQRLAFALSSALEGRGTTRPRDRFWMARGLGALMRWWGWIEPLHMKRVEEQLLLAWLLDSVEVGLDRQGVGRADRPASGSARARRRRPQLDRPRRGTEALDRRPRRQRRSLAIVSRLAARSASGPARRRDAQGEKARFSGRAAGAAVALGRGARPATKSPSGPSSGMPSSNRGFIAASRPRPGCRRTPT